MKLKLKRVCVCVSMNMSDRENVNVLSLPTLLGSAQLASLRFGSAIVRVGGDASIKQSAIKSNAVKPTHTHTQTQHVRAYFC